MSTVALNNLWTYIESMGLSNKNKQWLADKLIEPTKRKTATNSSLELKELESCFGMWSSDNEQYSVEDFIGDIDNVCRDKVVIEPISYTSDK